MSAKIIAASTEKALIGWSVTSTAISGVLNMVSRPCLSRSFRYSAMYRPACRMNQTGVQSTFSRRQAAKKRSLEFMDVKVITKESPHQDTINKSFPMGKLNHPRLSSEGLVLCRLKPTKGAIGRNMP